MLACESRRIDTLRTEPKATCMRMIESERAGPPAPGSLLSGGRASEPSTRMLLPVKSDPPGERAASAVSDECSASWAETMNTRNENNTQPSAATTTHLMTRPGEMGVRVRCG